MCVLYVRFGSTVRPRTFGCVAMASALLCILRSRLLLYSAGSSLFSFYIADNPRPTEPVKRVCYTDDKTVWATGVKISKLENSLNAYLEEITAYLKDNL